jgi:heptose I phosphotransferase
MTPLLLTLLAFAGGCLVLGVRPRRRRGFVEVNPRYRGLLLRHGLTAPADFLDLSAVIVSGHPGRNVARLTLANAPGTVTLYLKREHPVSWAVRLANFFAGFGLVSLSLREAKVLRALPQAGIDGPEWVAAGEDEHGRAFLLLRGVDGAVELRSLLGAERDPTGREQLAQALGAALAKLHAAGFDHPDLYAKHVLVDPDYLEIVFLDWQRSRRRRSVSRSARARDLAALNATVGSDLASARERLACLFAYASFNGQTGEETRALARAVLARSARLLARRHVREKRQPPAAAQQWVPLGTGELCVSPAFHGLHPARPEWLSLDGPAGPRGEPVWRCEVPLHGGARGVLVRRRARSFVRSLWDRLRLRPLSSPEQGQASLLLRLERYGVRVPRVLALGYRRGRFGLVDSLLLTESVADAEPLTDWVEREWDEDVRRSVLSQVGGMLRRLHEACCHLPDHDFPLALRRGPDGGVLPTLTGTEGLLVTRAPSPSLVARNLTAFERELRDAGATIADLRWLLEGYTAAGEPLPPPGAEVVAGREEAPAEAAGAGRTAVAVVRATTTRPVAAGVLPAARTPPPRASLWRRLFGGGRRLSERADWAAFAGGDWADRILGLEISDRFHAKQGRSTCRWVLHAPGPDGGERRLAVYLKRHYRLPWWQGLLAAFWPGGNWSPAFAEFEHLEWARALGVPVPDVVAAAEFIGPWGRFQSVLAVEELAGMLPLHEAVPLAATRLDADTFRLWKRGLVAEMARLTRILHDRRYFHKDLYLCHFYISRDDTAAVPEWRGRVYLIDLHRLARHPWTWRRWQTKDLAQLLYSSEVPGVDARDRLHFWREYHGSDGGEGGWLRRYVLFKWRRYRRHNARRKAASGPGG